MRNAYILIGKSEGKRLLRRSRSRSEEDIKIDLKDIGSEGVDGLNSFVTGSKDGPLCTK
jgi:hypothetical protein